MRNNLPLAFLKVCLVSSMLATAATAQSSLPGGAEPLFSVPEGVQTRWSSAENWKGEKGAGGKVRSGRKGSPQFGFKAGETRVLADVSGTSGIVRRIWVTISDRTPEMLRGIKLEMFWDGAEKPAVAVPIGDFFGHGLGRMATFQNALFSCPEGKSFNCYIPMPFRKGMKIAVTNESGKDLHAFYYDVDYTIGDKLPETATYFHAAFRRERPTKLQQDYEILPKVSGRGRYLGAHIGVIPDTGKYFRSWWGEGEVKVYLDGDDEYPTLCGTGTEDYIGTGWGQGQYAQMYQGCPLADTKDFLYCFYRLHVPDAIYFRQDARVTIQQIGCWGPDTIPQHKQTPEPEYKAGPGLVEIDWSKVPEKSYGLFERTDDWSSCAYFYLDKPENGLAPLMAAAERIANLSR